ncbi:hypothetical protein GH722_09650 [Alphaproteobacteria bacterium HT1-32]|nr:hypothetical protein [Alphaproteobacteria bacterium HT1-32]
MMTTELGKIARLEHVNLAIPDQQVATQFYVIGLGLTRDPAMTVGLTNMWINIGRSQMHLPSREPIAHQLRGEVTLTLPDIDLVMANLQAIQPTLSGSAFDFRRDGETVFVTCPWGNRFRLLPPAGDEDSIQLGLTDVRLDVPAGAADGIARFYQQIIGTTATTANLSGKACAIVPAGPGQTLTFQETSDPLPAYDGHHIQIYIAGFEALRRELEQRNLLSLDEGRYQFRFIDIVDPESGDLLYQIEHEVRGLDHPMFGRPLYNRNPAQVQFGYKPGRDMFFGTI